ncbi:cytochrome c [Aurantiacibacter poecillastricola]|uniref:cytochrome c n=1 Tax=Aurantiacibacter poecillastricola TaxID=3064385 RepID=UPI00273E6B57|nr:cytochrome c [Aurantiacibacter sp. 219JJ12-13]MDP5263173.1 cytochrome c [Aurantiacibacter sp. 219JJ12-13]
MRHSILMVSAGTALVAACVANPDGAVETAAAGSDIYYLRAGMIEDINPPTEAIWNMQVEVMDDLGNFDPALMTEQHWIDLENHARILASASARMALADAYVAADPSGPYTEAPVGTDLAAIQQRLDANPEAYRAFATNLGEHTERLLSAARSRDAGMVTQLVNDLQPNCKACHDVFWYPEEYQQ